MYNIKSTRIAFVGALGGGLQPKKTQENLAQESEK